MADDDDDFITQERAREYREDNYLLRERLEQVAEEMALIGKISNTPHAKRRWIEEGA